MVQQAKATTLNVAERDNGENKTPSNKSIKNNVKMTKDTKVATSNANENVNEANNASSVELIDIVKELTIEEGFDMETGDAVIIDNFSLNF